MVLRLSTFSKNTRSRSLIVDILCSQLFDVSLSKVTGVVPKRDHRMSKGVAGQGLLPQVLPLTTSQPHLKREKTSPKQPSFPLGYHRAKEKLQELWGFVSVRGREWRARI